MQDELTHYGIKGMHWGIRRFDYVPKGRRSSGTSQNNVKRSEAINVARKHRAASQIGSLAGSFAMAKAIASTGMYNKMLEAFVGKRYLSLLGMVVGNLVVTSAAASGGMFVASHAAEKLGTLAKKSNTRYIKTQKERNAQKKSMFSMPKREQKQTITLTYKEPRLGKGKNIQIYNAGHRGRG